MRRRKSPLTCAECGAIADPFAYGWRADRGDRPGGDDEPEL
jgi:hypothetical protein